MKRGAFSERNVRLTLPGDENQNTSWPGKREGGTDCDPVVLGAQVPQDGVRDYVDKRKIGTEELAERKKTPNP